MSGEERGRCRTHSCRFIQTTGFNTMSESLYCYLWFTNAADCRESDILGQLAWIIPVSIIAGIILLGVILLVIAKCILMAVVSLLPPLFNISSTMQYSVYHVLHQCFTIQLWGCIQNKGVRFFLLGSSLHCRCCKQCSYITLGSVL